MLSFSATIYHLMLELLIKWKEMERSGRDHLPTFGIRLKGLRKVTKDLCEGSWCPSRDLNLKSLLLETSPYLFTLIFSKLLTSYLLSNSQSKIWILLGRIERGRGMCVCVCVCVCRRGGGYV
jgi:hypothetical protein